MSIDDQAYGINRLKGDIREYANRQTGVSWNRPLAILLSGSSQGEITGFMQHVCQAISTTTSFPIYEIDVGKMTSGDEILNTFGQLSKTNLTNSIPIWLIHNFDANDEQWLRYYLAPMENGVFRTHAGSSVQLPACVLAFCHIGHSDYEISSEHLSDPKYTERKRPDFVARIRYHFDRVSPALADRAQANEVRRRIARAVRQFAEALALEIARNPEAIDEVEWRDMERLLAEVFEGLGFEVELTRSTKDGGKDIVLHCQDGEKRSKYLVEVKHWKSGKRVGDDVIRQFINVIAREQSDGGLLVSSSGYTEEAIEVVSELTPTKVYLGSRPKIIYLCKTYERTRSGLVITDRRLSQVLFSEDGEMFAEPYKSSRSSN